MKKMRTAAVVLLGLSLPVMAQAAEFQPIGALGMGGAGVARNNGALTAYWNPAGGAFNDSPFAMNVGVGVGAKGSDGLAENIDKLKDSDFNNLTKFDATSNVSDLGNVVKSLTILDDIQKRNGNITMDGTAQLAFSIKHFSFGVFGNAEGYISPNIDIENILPNTTGNAAVSISGLYQAAVTPIPGQPLPTTPSGYFSNDQLGLLAAQFAGSLTASGGLTAADKGMQLAIAIDNQLKGSNTPAGTTFNSLTTTIIPTLATGSGTFNQNTSSLMTKALIYYEVPLAYGHPFDFGKYGKLGIGATAKIIQGSVYQNQALLVNRPGGEKISSGDLVKEMTKNSESSTNFGIDLGALYKYDTWLSVGLVAKNLNSPKFKAPEYDAPVDNNPSLTVKKPGEDVTLKPQVRAGVAVDPLSWLTISSDLDLTDNETVAPGTVVGSSAKSRNFGGGLEVHPYSWLRIRGGAYKNLANSDVGTVLTAGFTLFFLDVDAAGTVNDTFKIGSTKIPQEAKLQVAMSFAF